MSVCNMCTLTSQGLTKNKCLVISYVTVSKTSPHCSDFGSLNLKCNEQNELQHFYTAQDIGHIFSKHFFQTTNSMVLFHYAVLSQKYTAFNYFLLTRIFIGKLKVYIT